MKFVKPLILILVAGGYIVSMSQRPNSQELLDKSTESWLMKPHEVVTNPDGVVRSKGHALELARLSLKYLFDADQDVEVVQIGMYWIGYNHPKRQSAIRHNEERYFVKINRASGAVEEYGPFP